MKIDHRPLAGLLREMFNRAGSEPPEDAVIARRLVESNLVGHDSHGVIRAPYYIDYLRRDMVRANRRMEVIFESGPVAVVDGHLGFGQSIGEQLMEYAVARSRELGVAVVALRNCGHLGRIGDWPAMAANAGCISLHWVNTSGFGLLVAPFGGIDRRLSANPIAAGIPVAGRAPVVLDISTSAIAEGKIKVAHSRGDRLPPGCVIDAQGRPTDNPARFYSDPPGSLLSFGGHKGYGLGFVAEVLAGALTGSGCSNPETADRLVNGMLSIVIDPREFPEDTGFDREVLRFIDWVKTSRVVSPGGEILVPGEIEERTRRQRLADGIDIDEATWTRLLETAGSLGLDQNDLRGLGVAQEAP